MGRYPRGLKVRSSSPFPALQLLLPTLLSHALTPQLSTSLKENWYTSKTLSIYSGFFIILNWVLVLGLAVRPFSIADEVAYYAVRVLCLFVLPSMTYYLFIESK